MPPLRRRLQSMLVTVALAGALLPFSPAEAGAAEPTFTVIGGGFGHSIGMSQFGAYGMALDGFAWEEIVGHYYTDTVVADLDPALADRNLFVGLRQDQTAITFTVRSTGASGPQASVTFSHGGADAVADVGQEVTIRHLGNDSCRLVVGDTVIKGDCTIDAEWDGFSGDPTTALEIASCTQPNWNAPGGTAYQPCMYARGGMRIRPDNNSQAFNVSVEIGLEDYVLGISESPYAWGSTGGMAALQAQAAAARSYAVRRSFNRGDVADRPWCHCTLFNSTVDQYYVGWGHGTAPWIEAVTSTENRVIVYPGDSVDGMQLPIEAFYSSSTFGWTEDSEDGFGMYVPYLRSVDDHWSQLPAVGNHSARWEKTLTASTIAALLPGMSTVTDVEVATCSTTGAALSLRFHGSGGPLTFPTSDLRSRLGLRSQQIINVGAPPPDQLPCSGPGLNPLPPGGPVALTGVDIDDDTEDDSNGNGNGIPEAGETVEISTIITNRGDDLAGVVSHLSSTDPYVSVMWNSTSSFGSILAGEKAANWDDWDLRIADDAPAGHTASLNLVVDADNGGAWHLTVRVTVGGSQPIPAEGSALSGLPDINGNGSADLAISTAEPGAAPRVWVVDGATGEIISESRLTPAGYTPVTSAVIGDVGGSPAPDIAILLTTDGPPALVRIVDTATGERLGSRRMGGKKLEWFDLAVGSFGGAATPDVAVAGRSFDGRVSVLTFDAGTMDRIRSARYGKMISVAGFESIPDYAGAEGDELAVVGLKLNGTTTAVVKDGGSGRLIQVLPFHDVTHPSAVAAIGTDGAVLIAADLEGGARLVAVDIATRQRVGAIDINLTEIIDMIVLGDDAGEPAGDLALLGTNESGALVSLVIDPISGELISRTTYPRFRRPAAIAAVAGPDGAAFAVAGNNGRSDMISVRTAATGKLVVMLRVD